MDEIPQNLELQKNTAHTLFYLAAQKIQSKNKNWHEQGHNKCANWPTHDVLLCIGCILASFIFNLAWPDLFILCW